MKKEPFKKDFTPEEIVQIVRDLGSEDYRRGSKGEYIFQTICHNKTGGSYKLYYYPESCMFHCYTECAESFDIYGLVQKVQHCNFIAAYRYIYNFFGIKPKLQEGFSRKEELDDWDIIRRYQKRSVRSTSGDQKIWPHSILDFYTNVAPIEWLSEGISREALRKYNIRFSISENKIIIPDYDEEGNLVGVRGRALNPEESLKEKYKPVVMAGNLLNYPTSQNLYGLYQNHETIKATHKVMLFEGEKSVMKCETFYPGNNFSVAVCGSQISQAQRDAILQLGVHEVFIAFDKEYETIPSDASVKYGDKLIKLAHMFSPFVTTYVLWDEKDLLQYKDSPVDRGQGVFESLMREKIEIKTEEGEICRKKKKT